MVDTKVSLCGIELDNPVIPSSGCFGYGYEFAELYDINMLGTFSFKGTTRDARFGNPLPRIAECTSGLINAVGLQNPGVHKVIDYVNINDWQATLTLAREGQSHLDKELDKLTHTESP